MQREKQLREMEQQVQDAYNEEPLRRARKGIPQWLQQIEAIQVPKLHEENNRFKDFPLLSSRSKESLAKEDKGKLVVV